MIVKFEKLTLEAQGLEEQVKKFSQVDKKEECDYIHYCGHDDNPPTPCRRIKVK